MSVQVKTPTKNQFEHTEIQCGDRALKHRDKASVGEKPKVRDDINLRNESKFSQPWNRKRRYSQSYHREESAARRKRLKSSPYFDRQLPTKFLNGGTIDDPLNLTGLESSELGKKLNSVTPQSSPLPIPRRQSVELRIPINVSDPLNLSGADEDGSDLEKLFKKRKQRHNRHKKKDDTVSANLFSPPKNIAKDKNLMEALRIDIEPEPVLEVKELASTGTSRDSSKPRQVNDKIVSPVVRQISPKSKKRRRKSDNKVEPSSTTSRPLSETEISPSSRNHKHKKFKHPKPPQKPQAKESSVNKNQPKFIYGNYNRYYGYRNPSMNSDQRLACLNSDWFDGKVALDIGCNVGHLTLSIARDFHPSKIVGIDIDQKLIAAARKNIRYYMSNEKPELKKFPISTVLNYGPLDAPPMPVKDKNAFPHNIMFMQGNYVLECDELLDMQKEEYDVVLAFSISKWIHFNWGDAGLKRFFKRVFKQLKPGGRFVLEPQPWSSYKKKKKLTPEIFQNFQNIRLRPDQFNDFLLSKEVGFSTCIKLKVPTHSSKGFCRPIMVYTKSDTVQNSPYPEMGNVTPVYSSYPPYIPGHLQPLVEESENSCSSSDSSALSGSKPSSTSASLDLNNSQKSLDSQTSQKSVDLQNYLKSDLQSSEKSLDSNPEIDEDNERPINVVNDRELVNVTEKMEEEEEMAKPDAITETDKTSSVQNVDLKENVNDDDQENCNSNVNDISQLKTEYGDEKSDKISEIEESHKEKSKTKDIDTEEEKDNIRNEELKALKNADNESVIETDKSKEETSAVLTEEKVDVSENMQVEETKLEQEC